MQHIIPISKRWECSGSRSGGNWQIKEPTSQSLSTVQCSTPLSGWLVGWFVGLLVHWFVGWLVEWVRTDVPQPLSSTVPLFTNPYVSPSGCSPTLYSPVPSTPTMYTLCFPLSMFPSPFAPRSLCSPVPLFPSLYIPQKWFPIPMFLEDIPQSHCYPESLLPSPDVTQSCFQSLCSPKMFPVPMLPRPSVPQSRCSPELENAAREHWDWVDKVMREQKDWGASLGNTCTRKHFLWI